MKNKIILYIDGDRILQSQVVKALESEGYKVVSAVSAFEAMQKIAHINIDAVLLANHLPDIESISFFQQIQSLTKARILIVSNINDTIEKITFLEMGADGYIVKPFEMGELFIKVKTIIDRSGGNTTTDESTILQNGWILNNRKKELLDSNQKIVKLTSGEFRLLQVFVCSPDETLSRENLFNLTRNGDFNPSDRSIDIQVARLRKKLGDDRKNPYMIKTIRGIGYMYSMKQY